MFKHGMGIVSRFRKFHRETVPFTGRAHIVYRFQQDVRVATEGIFARFKKDKASVILPANHESTIRVNRLLSMIVGAICCPCLASWTKEPLGWAAGLDWEAVVLPDENAIRASCWTGAGKIFVYTGLLNHFVTDEEIATVLAHEVGHVIANHSSEIIGWIAMCKWFPRFLLMPFFQRRELEADFIGMILLAASGFDPHVAPRTFEKLGEISRENMSNKIGRCLVLSTHPFPKKRSQFLLRPKVIGKVMELYTQVTNAG